MWVLPPTESLPPSTRYVGLCYELGHIPSGDTRATCDLARARMQGADRHIEVDPPAGSVRIVQGEGGHV